MTERFLFLGIVPTGQFLILTRSQDQFGISLAPIHRIDPLSMMLIYNNHWSFLIPEIPDLQLVVFLIVEGHCNLRGDAFAPADRDVSVSRGRCPAVSELEDGFVGHGIPEGDEAVLAG